MRHQKKGFKLGRKKNHRDAMLANMAVSLFIHGQIKTTTPKAKALREFAEKLITFAKKGDVHSRRMVLAKLKTKSRSVQNSVNFLFDKVAPLYVDRQGGYTQFFKLGFRKGDNAEYGLMKLIGYEGLSYESYLKKEDETPKAAPKKDTDSKPVKKQEAKAEVVEKKDAPAETLKEEKEEVAAPEKKETEPEEKKEEETAESKEKTQES